eukprot:8762616-Alexandrium_andersonii.AAC.1
MYSPGSQFVAAPELPIQNWLLEEPPIEGDCGVSPVPRVRRRLFASAACIAMSLARWGGMSSRGPVRIAAAAKLRPPGRGDVIPMPRPEP